MSKLIQMLLENNRQPSRSTEPLPKRQDVESEALQLLSWASQSKLLPQPNPKIGTIISLLATKELSKVDLLDPKKYAAIKKAIQAWRPVGSEADKQTCQKIRQALSAFLPTAQQKQRLELPCVEYQVHLKSEIEAELCAQFPSVYHDYSQNRSVLVTVQGKPQKQLVRGYDMTHFIVHQAAKLPIEKDSGLQKAIQKYEAMLTLRRTLHVAKAAPVQVQDFIRAFKQQKDTIEKHRDSAGVRFLKAIATVLTLGVAAACGIWSVKGEAATQKIGAVLRSMESRAACRV